VPAQKACAVQSSRVTNLPLHLAHVLSNCSLWMWLSCTGQQGGAALVTVCGVVQSLVRWAVQQQMVSNYSATGVMKHRNSVFCCFRALFLLLPCLWCPASACKALVPFGMVPPGVVLLCLKDTPRDD
jgi:hypothetical protein